MSKCDECKKNEGTIALSTGEYLSCPALLCEACFFGDNDDDKKE